MTTNTISTTSPTATNEERAKRLIDASIFWGERIADDTSTAKLTYTVEGVGKGAVATELTAGKHKFLIDEPAGLAGDDFAASPVEIALGAFIACQVVVYRLYAQGLGITIESIEATAEGDLDVRGLFGIDDTVRSGFSEIRITTHITGPETEERYKHLQAVVEAHCPVLDLFANTTPIVGNLVING